MLKDRLRKLEARKKEIELTLRDSEEPPPVLHPSMAVIYRERVGHLHAALHRDDGRTEAVELLRSLIREIVLTPAEGGELSINLAGDLAGILHVAMTGMVPVRGSRNTKTPAHCVCRGLCLRWMRGRTSVLICCWWHEVGVWRGLNQNGLIVLRKAPIHETAKMLCQKAKSYRVRS